MKKNVFTLLLIIVTFYSCQPENIDIKKTTYNYASKDGVELKLDKYSPSMISSKTPCVIFISKPVIETDFVKAREVPMLIYSTTD